MNWLKEIDEIFYTQTLVQVLLAQGYNQAAAELKKILEEKANPQTASE